MADGHTLLSLDDTRGVSNPDDCSPDGSPQKMISDCSDLYDLINFHSSATTQICEENSRRSASSSSSSPEIRKRSRSSSSSSGHSDGPDSDSGSFARTNGHAEPKGRSPSVEREVIPPASPESAVESCPEERATVLSSTEPISPADSPELMNSEGHTLLILEADKSVSSTDHELDDLDRGDPEPKITDDLVMVAVESMPSLHEPNNLLDIREADVAEEDSKPRIVREVVVVTEVHKDLDEEPKIIHVEEKTTIIHTTEIRQRASDDSQGSEVDIPGIVAEPFTVCPGETTEKDTHTETSHRFALNDGGAKEVHDLVDISDSFDHVEKHTEDSRVFVETVQIMSFDHTVTTTSRAKIHVEDRDRAKLDIPPLTQSVVLLDDNRELHASASGSDSDSEYTPGKKFKQMKTKLVTESASPVSSSGMSNTSTTTKISEMKMELSTSKTELENGNSMKNALVQDVNEENQPYGSNMGGINILSMEKSHVKGEEEREETAAVALDDIENAPSVAALKTTFIATEQLRETEKETILTGVSIKDLKASFDEQKMKTEEMRPKEVIDTGIDIKSLRNSYGSLNRIEDDSKCNSTSQKSKFFDQKQRALSSGDLNTLDLVLNLEDERGSPVSHVIMRAKSHSDLTRYEEERQQEVVHTGVSVKALRASYCDLAGMKDCNNYKYRQTVNTGVSIRSLKSSFSSTDSIQHHEFNDNEGVKIDRNKITRNFSQVDYPLYALLDSNEVTNVSDEATSVCRICGKQVFHMERIKAEKGVFHKTCFRCKECSKPLSVDTYCSHEGVLYCRPHFRQLFQPKAKFEEPVVIPHRRRHEMIVKENTPAELPPDVVRCKSLNFFLICFTVIVVIWMFGFNRSSHCHMLSFWHFAS